METKQPKADVYKTELVITSCTCCHTLKYSRVRTPVAYKTIDYSKFK